MSEGIEHWLETLGLACYADIFARNYSDSHLDTPRSARVWE